MDNDNIKVIDEKNDDDGSQCQSDESHHQDEKERKLEELFRVLGPLCLKYLKASHLIHHLSFLKEHAKMITKTERKSASEATIMLFDVITKCMEPKKWRKFVLALEKEEFLSLYKVCAVCENDNFDSYVKIFDLLSVDFAEHGVEIADLSREMCALNSLKKEEFEQIQSVLDEDGEVAAILEFISCVPSSLEKWFNDLSSCLSGLKKEDLQKLIKKKGTDIFSGEDNNIEILIEYLKPLIISRVRFNDIWSYLKGVLDLPEPISSDLSDQIKMKNILNEIRDSQSLGKWRSFYNALQAAGYESLCKQLDSDTDVRNDEEDLKIIMIFIPKIKLNISVGELLCSLESRGVITQADTQEIKHLKAQKGDISAAELLLDSIHRKKDRWFPIFLQCLVDNGQQEIAKKIDPCYKDHLEKKCLENEEEIDEEDEIGKESIELRDYQIELLVEPRKGKNCIICAETGSGKTIVALQLIEEHLAQNDGQIHKVVFLANQVALVQQQGRQCKKYLSQYKSYVLTGNNASDNQPCLGENYNENDIILLTPRILLDNLNEGNLPSKSLSLFSLIIFDECHHTNKKHPYNELMAMYIDEKLEKGNSYMHLPQIIGLTASIGVGGAKSEIAAVSHIQKICANLDCEELCTIKENQEELRRYISRPDDQMIIVDELSDDPFKDGINDMMIQIENKLTDPEVSKDVIKENRFLYQNSKNHPSEREKNLYTNWLGDLKKLFLLLKNRVVRLHYHICWDFLNIYHNALIINDSCRIKDAITYIEAKLENSSELPTNKLFKQLWDEKKAHFLELSRDDRYFNPLLQKLENIVLKTMEEIPDSRILIFVRTRSLVSALTDWIRESEKLKFLNPEKLVGGSQRVDNPGMTTQQQEQKLAEFKLGNCKVLVATLGEEGLDIAKCNLVLNYNDVKNEISLVQKRGRARAKNSQYMTLANVSSGISEREKGNVIREKLMNEALKKVQQLKDEDPKAYSKVIEDLQKTDKSIRECENHHGVRTLNEDEYELGCIKCSEFFGLSSEVRVIHETQYTFLNEEFDSKLTVKMHPKPKTYDNITKVSKIFCRICLQDLGIKVIYNKRLFPIIKIGSFLLRQGEDKPMFKRQWKDVPFKVKSIKSDELSRFPIA